MIIHRTPEFVSLTPGVIAIGNGRRLAARRRVIGHSEATVLVFETMQDLTREDGSVVDTFWGREKDAKLQPHERLIPTVPNRIGGMGAYCEVVPSLELKQLVVESGLRWCARERSGN